MSTPMQTHLPFKYDNFLTAPHPSPAHSGGLPKRNRRNRRGSQNSSENPSQNRPQSRSKNPFQSRPQSRPQNRERSDSMVSHDGHNDGYHQRYRTESNVSNFSAASQMSSDSKSRPSSSNRNRQQNQRNLRWDRDRLSKEIWRYYEDNRQSPDLLTRKTRLKDALHKILTTNFSNYDVELHIVGSTATGLANNHSDVDICIVMNEIDSYWVDSETTKPRTYSWIDSKENTDPKEVLESGKEFEEKTAVGVIVDVDETDATIVSSASIEQHVEETEDKSSEDKSPEKSDQIEKVTSESLSPSSANSNGKIDPSIPMLEKIEEVLKNYSFVTKMQIILAKVPILKFFDRISGIEVTLNVNKLVSIRNTHLIHDYTKLDWRVQPLMMVIKAWAKDHNIKDAYNKSISSYSLVLMVIHYLQSACHPPVLPCLQQLDPHRYDPNAYIHTIRMDRRLSGRINWRSYNESSLKDLLIGFLDYYSYTFCYTKDAISVRKGGVLPKAVVQRYKSDENSFTHWKYLSIEEPFNRTNTARSVYDEVMFEHILSVFRVSHYTIRRYPCLDSIMTGRQFSNQYMNMKSPASVFPTGEQTTDCSYEKQKSPSPQRSRRNSN